jgi:integrase
MANLYKKALIQRDPETGKRTPYKTEKWWARYRDAHGVTKRVALSENKNIAQRMLAEIVQKVELEKAGVLTDTEKHVKRPIAEHLNDFECHLRAKNNDPRYVNESLNKIRRMVSYCNWRRISDLTAQSVEAFLTNLRTAEKRSIQTQNHYLIMIKSFCNWLIANERLVKSPILKLKSLNMKTDQRHHRRPLSEDEFQRLIEAAEHGGPSVGLCGADRAMLYVLAAWTGFRKGELGSLTLRSFDLSSSTPTVKIQAAYSKRRRHDSQVLHPDLVDYFLNWVTQKRFNDIPPEADVMATFLKMQSMTSIASEILLPVSGKSGGVERDTAAMIGHDLATARKKWVAEGETEKERREREDSDFLRYRNSEGKFADFHGLRHTFISNHGKAGVSPKTAQVLARHSTIELTMQVYMHIDEAAQVEAIYALPGLRRKE